MSEGLSTLRTWVVAGWAIALIGGATAIAVRVGVDELGVLLSAIMFVAVGAFLMIRVPGNLVGAVMTLGGSAWLVYALAGEYARQSLVASSPLPMEYFAAWLGSWVGALLPPSIAALVALFPDGSVGGSRRWLLVGLLIPVGLAIVGAIQMWGVPVEILNDFDALGSEPSYVLVDNAFILGFASVLPSLGSLLVRFRRSTGIERQQVKWFLLACCLFGVGFVSIAVFDDPGSANPLVQLIATLSIGLLPTSIAVAVARYRLYEIDRIVSRTVAYTLVAGLLSAVYLIVVTILTVFLPSDDPVVVAVSTLAAAAVFNPVRTRVQRFVDRKFNRSRYDAEQVVGAFSGAFRDGSDLVKVVAGWMRVVEETMEPVHMTVWVRES